MVLRCYLWLHATDYIKTNFKKSVSSYKVQKNENQILYEMSAKYYQCHAYSSKINRSHSMPPHLFFSGYFGNSSRILRITKQKEIIELINKKIIDRIENMSM